ncbi:unnamed protein product [Rhizophagus irregularis]|uniref:Uncharacterized protein n=1 Tax=Rhizophagus irregularis TaxID=588596 RepID=A0A916E210_9GLOM|nr:unnamed protein product [Rhizophagus irregularis]
MRNPMSFPSTIDRRCKALIFLRPIRKGEQLINLELVETPRIIFNPIYHFHSNQFYWLFPHILFIVIHSPDPPKLFNSVAAFLQEFIL